MRLLYLVSSYPRWSETFVRQDISLLKEAGVDLFLCSLFGGECDCREEWPKAVYLSEPSPAVRRNQVTSWGRKLPGWIRERVSLFRHRRLLESLVHQCRALKIEHIFGEFADLAGLLACEAAKRTGCGYSLGLHACDVHTFKYTRRLFREASSVFICNEAARRAFLSLCPEVDSKTFLIPHGMDLRVWTYAMPRVTGHLLFVGRLVPKKGVGILLEALRLLTAGGREVCLDVIGSGPLESELVSASAGLPVRWLGRLEREEVRQRMLEGGILVMPSVVTPEGDRDGVPNVVLEAMATGMPVVGSQAGGLPEVLTAQTGWPVSELTPAHLADAIAACMESADECVRRCRGARQLVEERYDARQTALERKRRLGA